MCLESSDNSSSKNNFFQIDSLQVDAAVSKVLNKMKAFNPSAASNSNTTDPFAALIEWAFYSSKKGSAMLETEWRKLEIQRQLQKNMMNFIGEAHQEIIGTLSGWKSYPAGSGKPDVVGIRGNQKIIAEIKNKANTLNAGSGSSVVSSLEDYLQKLEFQDFIAFKVAITKPQTSRTKLWRYLKDETNKNMLDVSGRVFYAIAVDPKNRIPEQDFDMNENMNAWESWSAFDFVTNSIITCVETQTGLNIPDWVKDLFRAEIGWQG